VSIRRSLIFAICALFSNSIWAADTPDLIGIWEMQDIRTKQQVRIVEFKTDGRAAIQDQTNLGDITAQYKLDDNVLTFSAATDGDRRRPNRYLRGDGNLEKGKVQWVSTRVFWYTVENPRGYGSGAPRTYEANRMSSPDADADFRNLIGTWQQTGSERYESLGFKLCSDGSYFGDSRNTSNRWNGSRQRYFYKDHILTIVEFQPDGRHQVKSHGQVTWKDSNHIQFKILGNRGYQAQSTMAYECLSHDEPPNPAGEVTVDEGPVDPTWAKSGELAGIWLGTDSLSRIPCRVLEFGPEKSLSFRDDRGQEITGRFDVQGTTLRLIQTFSGRGSASENPLEESIIEWRNARQFHAKVTSSSRYTNGPANRQFDYFRYGAKDDPSDAPNLIGTWTRRDPTNLYGANETQLQLNDNGTCEIGNNPRSYGGGNGTFFKYKDHILSILTAQAGGDEQLLERGRVYWISEKHFRFRRLDGLQVQAGQRGTVCDFEKP
jgi:hypothetical protein